MPARKSAPPAPLLGAHISTAGGVDKAVERALGIGCTAAQTFVKNNFGLEGFRYIMSAPQFREIPKVLETPKGKEMKEDVENMSILRGLMAGSSRQANEAPL
jgi:endonuclease IV